MLPLFLLFLTSLEAFPTASNLTAAMASSGAYSDSWATKTALYSMASYCCGTLGDGVAKWDCATCKRLPHLDTVVVYSRQYNVNGYVGYDAANDMVMVAFAGTDPLSITNWIDDLNFVQQTYSACSGCKVHSGFLQSYQAVQVNVRSAVKTFLSAHPSASVHVTGHSLGAALATHAALDLVAQGINVADVYTFGQPRVGNTQFSNFVKTTFGGSFWRVTHGFDPVPHLPLEAMGFHHTATEVFYNEFQTSHTVCNGSGEDPRCSNQYLLDLNVLDHLTYMKQDFTANYLSCKL